MSFFPGQTTMMQNEASHSAMSEINPSQDLSAFTSARGLPDGYSLEDVFAAMTKDLADLFDKIQGCKAELHHVSKQGNSRKSRSHRGSSQNTGENKEYMEILNEKGKLLEEITATIDKMDSSPEIPKAKIHCYQKYAALLKQRFENINQEISVLIEDEKKTKQEYERLEQQVETFKMLKNDEENTNEGHVITQLFKEVKTDLNTLLTALYPDEVKEEFFAAVTQLTNEFIKNDNEEDQYVELSPKTLQNYAIICLIRDHVIVEDPSNPAKYRLNMAE